MNTRRAVRALIAVLCAVPSLAACVDDPAEDSAASEGAVGSEDPKLHTENHELVCRLNDFLGTKVFVDRDGTLDAETGKLSSKVLEMATKNAFGNNNKLFQVQLVRVERARCLGCEDTQVILYRSMGDDGPIAELNKLETTKSHAKITRNVDNEGTPLGSVRVVDEGPCEPNEVD